MTALTCFSIQFVASIRAEAPGRLHAKRNRSDVQMARRGAEQGNYPGCLRRLIEAGARLRENEYRPQRPDVLAALEPCSVRQDRGPMYDGRDAKANGELRSVLTCRGRAR